ncbi:translation initiation factor eIF-1A [Necator americanus]|uniref:Eukaryotic translation initiation factor 4C n=1 Tax=Necator americanus TaxID=51031 RepID=W2SK50_NECAM|nr:translation initiation factor eIF-1A [Necator americanus]ETN69236.1 translation initiation factor eIF-1A [Necator americanus]
MPKNKGKGGKNRRRGKNENDFMKRELDTKDVGQEYGQVSKMLGNGRVLAFCFDGKQRVCHIRGKLRKKVWINTGDIILVGLRDYQDDKGDVILKYTPDEARRLKEKNELPEHAKINENDEQEEGEIEFSKDSFSFEEISSYIQYIHIVNMVFFSGDLGAESGEEEGEEEDNNMPSSGSEESEEESEEEEEEGSDSDEDSDNFVNEEDLARGRGLKPSGRGGRNKYNKRR